MQQPLTIVITFIGGYELKLPMDRPVQPDYMWLLQAEDRIQSEIEKAGIPKNQQIIVHDSTVLANEMCRDNEGTETSLKELLEGLGDDVTSLTLTVVKRDPVVAQWLEKLTGLAFVPAGFAEAPAIAQRNEEVLLACVRVKANGSMHFDAFGNAPPELRADATFMRKVVASDAYLLQYAADALKADRSIVLAAVRSDGRAIHFASNEQKADKEIVGTAIMSSSDALAYASDELKNDKDFLWTCVRINPETIEFAGKLITDDDQLMREYAKFPKKSDRYLKFVSSALQNDKEYVMDAIKINIYAILEAGEDLKQDRDLWLQAMDDHDRSLHEKYLFRDVPQSLKEDWEFAVECLRIGPMCGFGPNAVGCKNFPTFSKTDLEAEVLKRGGEGSRSKPWEGKGQVFDSARDRYTGPWPFA